MIDLACAKREFQEYLKEYDPENEKIKLKIIHTYGVVKYAGELARRMQLSQEDVELAELIGLLHDIGRFEQVKRFDSFDRTTMSHAEYGVELLFGEQKLIRRFLEKSTWDEIIRVAIARHSDFSIEDLKPADTSAIVTGQPEATADRIYLHAALIRDADKLDNCRVKLEDRIEVLLNETAEKVGTQPITDAVWQDCLAHTSVHSEHRRNAIDHWVSYVAYFFDLNFQESRDIIEEEGFVDRIIDRIPYSNPDSWEKMEILRRELKK